MSTYRHCLPLALLAAIALFAPSLEAAPAAQVVLLQAPAWLERDGERRPLTPRMALENDDRVVTGTNSRAVLRLAEGSIVKLGETATLSLSEMAIPADESDVFRGFLDVIKGAFRFTTQLSGRRRDVRARVGTATIGIRGTDVWGKTEPERDFVVLLEGAIEIERDGEVTPLSEPLSLYMAPRDTAVAPIAPVDPNDLARWAQETEPQDGQGRRGEGGGYTLHLASFSDAAGAARLVERLARAGYAGAAAAAEVDGKNWWRVSMTAFVTAADARELGRQLAQRFDLVSPWISR